MLGDKRKLSCTYTCAPVQTTTTSYVPLLLFAILVLIAFSYFAHVYPQWKAERERHQNLKREHLDNNSPALGNSSTITTQEPSLQRQESMLSARWIPYLPLAVILVAFKAVWESFRHLVLRSILAAEESGPYLKSWAKKAAHWTIHHGPAFVRTDILEPVHTLTVVLWDSMATAIEHTIVPTMVRFYTLSYNHLKDPTLNTLAWMLRAARFVLGVTEWFLVQSLQCLYYLAQAFWKRFSVLGIALVQAAETTLYGLAKDVRDLGYLIAKGATWAWGRILLCETHLRALGAKLGELTELAAKSLTEVVLPWCLELRDLTFKNLAESLPRIAQQMYALGAEFLPKFAKWTTSVLRLVGKAVMDGIHFIQSHPTFTEGVEVLSLKVKEGFLVTLERLESVNWLMFLEELLVTLTALVIEYAYDLVIVVIDMITPYYLLATFIVEIATTFHRLAKDPTDVVNFIHHHSTTIRQSVGRNYRVFVSRAYHDFRVAIEIAQPIVSLVVNILVWIVRHLWQAASQTWAIVHLNATLAMAWAHLKIGVPVKNVWDTKVMPGLHAAQVVVREQSPVLATAVWAATLKTTEILQSVLVVLTLVMTRIIELSGALGGRVQEQWKNAEPHLEDFKKRTGEVMDIVFQELNTRVMDWTKNEKRREL